MMRKPVNDFVIVGIRRIRLAKGLRVQDMADRCGIPLGSYSCLESGRYRLSLDNLFRIVNVLGVDVCEVWPQWGEPPRPLERVDERFISTALHKAVSWLPAQVSLGDVLDAVCQVYGVTRQQLESPSRARRLAQARTVATILTREQGHLTMISLSRALGRDVSSLSHCLRRLRRRLPWDRKLQAKIKQARRRLGQVYARGQQGGIF